MSINVKKYTKDQMAKMWEDAQEKADSLSEEAAHLYSRNDELTKSLGITEKLLDAAKCKEADSKLSLRMLRDENSALKQKNTMLTESISQMNGEAVNKANEIANLKADADALRNKLADTEAALGRANAEVSHYKSELRAARKGATDAQWAQIDEYRRAEYAESHPWRNLWAWVKRKVKMA